MNDLQAAKDAARKYWTLRNAGDNGTARAKAFVKLLNALDEARLAWHNFADAAQIGLELLSGIQNTKE